MASTSTSADDASEYLFHEESPGTGVYVRKCFGIEELSSNMEEHCDGFVHLTNSASVTLSPSPSSVSSSTLKSHVRAAWTALRHHTPAIACRAFRYTYGDRRFAFRYRVPGVSSSIGTGAGAETDVNAWVDETLFFDTHARPLYETHCALKDGRWWRGSDDHYVAELHVSPGEGKNKWQFSIIFSHSSIDGRNSFAIMDLFLSFLTAVLDGTASPTSSLEWGTEVPRLPPPGPFVMALAESGAPPSLELPTPPAGKAAAPAPAPPMIPWLYAPRATGATGDVARLVKFSAATTAQLHAAARRHGGSITQVVTALSALAHAEAALQTAGSGGDAARFEEVAQAYAASTHYLVAWNFINHRHKFPGGYDTYTSPGVTRPALCTCDGVPLLLPMDPLRATVAPDAAKLTTRRTLDADAFWASLVREVADAWKGTDQTLDGYYARELASHHAFGSFNPHMFDVPALIVSSVGDLGRLGLLDAYHPAPGKVQRVVVDDVVCGIRIRTPPLMGLLWEYRGELACHFFTAGEYMTPAALALATRLFEEWAAALVQ
ncbi:hypothetical protein M0805_005018 [Coniferiporia weirii]|nr:hypothetical protein M0805_005018 [Coniferiporia weirii]